MRSSSPKRRRLEDGVAKPTPSREPMVGSSTKAITVYQPWATLIVVGAKPYEFRGWNPRERGAGWARYIGQRIVIHAAAKAIDTALVESMLELQELYPATSIAAQMCLHRDKAIPVLMDALAGRLPMSAGVGTAVLGEPRNGIEIAEEFGVPRANDSDRDEHANWGWPMLEIEKWDVPVPCRGLQGFWGWPTPTGMGLV
jgi:hypothetical protein